MRSYSKKVKRARETTKNSQWGICPLSLHFQLLHHLPVVEVDDALGVGGVALRVAIDHHALSFGSAIFHSLEYPAEPATFF